ncbi:MAG TPA: hypothetical protein VM261_25890 [Kofleriaceae bacterium]|nr:hypothetical protein [Kofleriaceae bacterium]
MLRARLITPITVGGIVVAVLGLAVELVHSRSHAEAIEALVGLLSLSYEQNLPTWYASMLLAACAVLLAAIATTATAFRRHWWLLAGGFALMSLDEVAELHEHAGALVDLSDTVYFDWIVPAAILVALLGLVFLPFLRALPAARRRDFVVAAALFLGGAVVMELPLGWWTARAGDESAGYALIDWVEESLELAGASWFLLALTTRWDDRAEATP